MRRFLAVSEYTVQLALIFASGILALFVKGKTKMAAQRRFRNRRTRDPMNLAAPPGGCCVFVGADGSTTTYCRFNAALDLTVADISTWLANGNAPVSVERISDTEYNVTWADVVTTGDACDFTSFSNGHPFGPNIVPTGSFLMAQ